MSLWISDNTLVSGVSSSSNNRDNPYAYIHPDGSLRLLVGSLDGTLRDHKWNGSSWTSQGNLPGIDVGSISCPTVFKFGDGSFYIIVGNSVGSFSGFKWNGSSWVSNGGIVSGLGSLGNNDATPDVFLFGDGIYRLLSGHSSGNWFGWSWNGTQWVTDNGIKAGLTNVGTQTSPRVLKYNGSYYLITPSTTGGYNVGHWISNGFKWDDSLSSWVSDSSIVDGLNDFTGNGGCARPTIFTFTGSDVPPEQSTGQFNIVSSNGATLTNFIGFKIPSKVTLVTGSPPFNSRGASIPGGVSTGRGIGRH